MKKRKLNKKLALNKEKIASLDNHEMGMLKGGDFVIKTINCPSIQIICLNTTPIKCLPQTLQRTCITCKCPEITL